MPRGNGELVLLVDDEEPIRNVMRRWLEQFNYCVPTASDGEEAISIVLEYQEETRVVVTDSSMPRVDGVAVTRALKKDVPGMKIMVATDLIDSSSITELETLGVSAIVSKPFAPSTVVSTLRTALA